MKFNPQWPEKNSLVTVRREVWCHDMLTLSQRTNFRPFQIEKSLQTTILNLMKMADSSPKG